MRRWTRWLCCCISWHRALALIKHPVPPTHSTLAVIASWTVALLVRTEEFVAYCFKGIAVQCAGAELCKMCADISQWHTSDICLTPFLWWVCRDEESLPVNTTWCRCRSFYDDTLYVHVLVFIFVSSVGTVTVLPVVQVWLTCDCSSVLCLCAALIVSVAKVVRKFQHVPHICVNHKKVAVHLWPLLWKILTDFNNLYISWNRN